MEDDPCNSSSGGEEVEEVLVARANLTETRDAAFEKKVVVGQVFADGYRKVFCEEGEPGLQYQV